MTGERCSGLALATCVVRQKEGDMIASSGYLPICGPCDSTCFGSHIVSILILVFI